VLTHRRLAQCAVSVPLSLPQHPNRHRAKRLVLLAVDQELGERAAPGVPQNSPIRSARSKSGGMRTCSSSALGSRPERVQALTKPALELVGSHVWESVMAEAFQAYPFVEFLLGRGVDQEKLDRGIALEGHRRRSPGSRRQAGRNHAASPRALSSAVSSASGRPRLLARASASRHLRARLPHEVPGSGLSAPVLPWPSKTTRPPRFDRRVIAASPHMVSGGDPASVRKATCWRTKVPNVAISTHTKASGGPESCRL
jgi:hypothetical protein